MSAPKRRIVEGFPLAQHDASHDLSLPLRHHPSVRCECVCRLILSGHSAAPPAAIEGAAAVRALGVLLRNIRVPRRTPLAPASPKLAARR